MGLANEQRRTEQLWWTRDLIEDLIVEKSPDFLEYHKNIDELIKQYEPEILAVFIDMEVIIGLACVQIEEKKTRNLYLKEFEVATDAQGNGFSNIMLEYVFKYARNHGCQYITLMTFDDNAFEYWKHQGFTVSTKSTPQIRLFFKIKNTK